MITQKELKEILEYDENTGKFYWAKDRGKSIRKGAEVGGLMTDGHVQIRIHKKHYYAHRIAWCYVYGYFPENGIDHINRVKYDNRICNLREVSKSCNMANTGVSKVNKSGVRGVHFEKTRNVWKAYIRSGKKMINIGNYKDKSEAVAYRYAYEQCLKWSSCDNGSSAKIFLSSIVAGIR
jgi:hypothetical protein